MRSNRRHVRDALLVMAAALCLGESALARESKSPAPTLSSATLSDLQAAFDEHRYGDAQRLLSQAVDAGVKDLRLALIEGDLNMAQGRPAEALAAYRRADADRTQRARALEGEGVALTALGRADEGLKVLKAAVAADPTCWRAWNALGVQYDAKGEWSSADEAYFHALAGSGASAVVYNNRGYSHLLRRQWTEAVADFVSALRLRPDLGEARTNLRLALALKGDYPAALKGAGVEDDARLLNNAGFAAMLSGDYDHARDMLSRAVTLHSTYYGRAAENLRTLSTLKASHDPQPSTLELSDRGGARSGPDLGGVQRLPPPSNSK